jgi:microcystin-dependent protein
MGVLKVRVGDEWVPVGGIIGGVREAGEITMWPGATAPEGWMLCDGAAVSRTSYHELFAVIGTTYGAGDGSTTFNLPNLKGRVPVGRDAAQTEFDALGESGGAKTHTLTTAEIPSHSHGLTQTYVTAGGVGVAAITYTATSSNTGPSGGGGAHNNLQPYLTLNYIIRLSTDRGSRPKSLMTPVIKRLAVEQVFTVIGTVVPLTGLSHTFTVENASDVFAVEAIIDFRPSGITSAQWLGLGFLFLDGVSQPGYVVSGGTEDVRSLAPQKWHLTGLAPGAHTVEIRAYKGSGTVNVHVAAGHTTLEIVQLPTTVGDATSRATTTTVNVPSSNNNTGNNTAYRTGNVVEVAFGATASVARGGAEVFAVLPEGYRPAATKRYQVMDLGTGGVVPIYVDAAGNCVHIPSRSAGSAITGNIIFTVPA